MGKINCRPAPESTRRAAAVIVKEVAVVRLLQDLQPHESQPQERRLHESFTTFHSPAGGDHAVNGGRAAGGMGCVYATSGFSLAGSGLPDDSGGDVLSGSGPRCDGVFSDFAAGAPVRAGSGTQPD